MPNREPHVGDHIRVITNEGCHFLRAGDIVRIREIDDDILYVDPPTNRETDFSQSLMGAIGFMTFRLTGGYPTLAYADDYSVPPKPKILGRRNISPLPIP